MFLLFISGYHFLIAFSKVDQYHKQYYLLFNYYFTESIGPVQGFWTCFSLLYECIFKKTLSNTINIIIDLCVKIRLAQLLLS